MHQCRSKLAYPASDSGAAPRAGTTTIRCSRRSTSTQVRTPAHAPTHICVSSASLAQVRLATGRCAARDMISLDGRGLHRCHAARERHVAPDWSQQARDAGLRHIRPRPSLRVRTDTGAQPGEWHSPCAVHQSTAGGDVGRGHDSILARLHGHGDGGRTVGGSGRGTRPRRARYRLGGRI